MWAPEGAIFESAADATEFMNLGAGCLIVNHTAYDTLLQAAREMEASLNEVQNNGARASDGKWSVISQSLYSFRAVLKELGEE